MKQKIRAYVISHNCNIKLIVFGSRQISQLLDESKRAPVSLQQIESQTPQRKSSVIHAPIPAPPADDMEPQNISFIGNADKISEGESVLSQCVMRENNVALYYWEDSLVNHK